MSPFQMEHDILAASTQNRAHFDSLGIQPVEHVSVGLSNICPIGYFQRNEIKFLERMLNGLKDVMIKDTALYRTLPSRIRYSYAEFTKVNSPLHHSCTISFFPTALEKEK